MCADSRIDVHVVQGFAEHHSGSARKTCSKFQNILKYHEQSYRLFLESHNLCGSWQWWSNYQSLPNACFVFWPVGRGYVGPVAQSV
jgi:hypothetical protein